MYVVDGADFVFSIDYKIDGQFKLPDVASVTYTLYAVDGTVLGGLLNVVVTTDAVTVASVATILATNNTLAVGQRLEVRKIRVKFTSGTIPYSLDINYRVIPWLMYDVTPSVVRGYMGVNTTEVLDSDIDLNQGYLILEDKAGQTVWESAFTDGGTSNINANKAMAVFSALSFIPTLQLRIAQSESSSNRRFDRLRSIDWDSLYESLSAEFNDAFNAATGRSDAIPTFLIVGEGRTDPITNA